jgi:RNA polymerase sigma factor (sigma-70 family)
VPKTDPPRAANDGIETLFHDLHPAIPVTIRRVCGKFGYRPDAAAFEGLVQRIIVLLIDDEDYRRLRTFDGRSSPETWLDRVVRNYIGHHLRKLEMEVSLDALPEDSFVAPPDQEEIMLFHEWLKILAEAVSALTKRERNLYQLVYEDGLTTADIAKEMGIKPASVHRYKHDLNKKIKMLVDGGAGGRRCREEIFFSDTNSFH